MPSDKQQINTYFICATQYTNLGDLLINKMLVDELCKYGKVFIDFSTNIPDNFRLHLLENPNTINISEKYGFSARSFSLKSLCEYIKLIKKYKINLLTRSPGPLSEPSSKIRLGFSFMNLIGRIFGAKVIYFGNCCSEAFVKSMPIRTTYMNEVLIRSKETVEFAKKHLKCPVSYIPDLAFLMTSPKIYSKEKIVIVDFRVMSDYGDVVNDVKNLVDKFLYCGYKVELYYQVQSDKETAESLFEQVKTEGVTLRDNIVWYDEIEEYYSNKAFVISNRLHSLLLGAAYGVIPIARISSDPKLQKVKHVFESSLPECFYKNIDISTKVDVHDLVQNEKNYRDSIVSSMLKSKRICSSVIAECISRNS